MEVVLNGCYGGFGLSDEAEELFHKRTGIERKEVWGYEDYRANPILVDIVKELGDRANRRSSDLYIVEIPDEYDYWVEDYDGVETLHKTVRFELQNQGIYQVTGCSIIITSS